MYRLLTVFVMLLYIGKGVESKLVKCKCKSKAIRVRAWTSS